MALSAARPFTALVSGGHLAGERRGEGEPVLFLHGLGLDRRAWDDVTAALAATHETIAFDLRGHGASPAAREPYASHDDIARVLDGLALEHAHLVGHSMGGQVALDSALAHPGRIRSLALVDSALSGHAWSAAWSASIRAVREIGAREGAEAAKRAWLEHPLFARARPLAGARLEAMVLGDSGARWLARDPAVALGPRAAGRLAEVRVPTLVVVGEHDLVDFRQIARALHAGIAGARLETLAGVGHVPPLEAPQELSRILAGFLAGAGDA